MFVRCDNCGWSQDDLWEQGYYTPVRRIKEEDYLFEDKVYVSRVEAEEAEGHGQDLVGYYITGRQAAIACLNRAKIRCL